MFSYLQIADLYRQLAAAYDKIDSFEKQGEILNSLNEEKYTSLQEYCQTLKNIISTKEITIQDLNEQIDLLNKNLEEDDQREGQFPSEF